LALAALRAGLRPSGSGYRLPKAYGVSASASEGGGGGVPGRLPLEPPPEVL